MKVKYIHVQEDPANKAQSTLRQDDIPERTFEPGEHLPFGKHWYKVVRFYDDAGVRIVIVTGKPAAA